MPLKFLEVVLPSAGFYCVTELTTNKKEQRFAATVADLLPAYEEFKNNGYDTFVCMASFKTDTSRLGVNAQYVRCFWIDIDCNHPKDLVDKEKAYPSAKEAAAALQHFIEETGLSSLGTPWVNYSGGGIHAYWPFTTDITVERWLPAAENLKRLCFDKGFKIDMGITADRARIMRVPGTTNTGIKGGKAVREATKARQIVEGDIFEFEAIEALLLEKLNGHAYQSTQLALPGTRPVERAKAGTVLTVAAEYPPSSFKKLMQLSMRGEGCEQVAWWFANGHKDGVEPVWTGLLGIAALCDDSEKAFKIITDVHGYDEQRMRKKISERKGHWSCTKFDSENLGVCGSCKHFGRTTKEGKPFFPIMLGSYTPIDDTERTISVETPSSGDPIILVRPEPPFGYHYGAKGGVMYMEADSDGKYTIERTLLPYDLYAVAILNQRGTHEVQMMAHRPEGVITVIVPSKCLSSKDECVKALNSQNILCSSFSGAKGDEKLHQYVKFSAQKLSAGNHSVSIPENMGWQEDGSFVLNERIYKPDGTMQHVPMKELKNLTNGLQIKGTIEGWRGFPNMLIRRGLFSHLTVGTIGFATPLMRFLKGLHGCTMHACSGDSGYGKSLALDMASSVWGDPLLYRSGTGTSVKALMQRAGHANSLPLVLDEITTEQRQAPEWLPEFLLSFSQGKQRDRMEGGANKERENVATWSTLAILSSNTYGMDYLSAGRNHASKGEILRMLEWSPTVKLKFEPHEIAEIRLLSDNHGIAGEMWAKWLVTNVQKAEEVVLRCFERVEAEMTMDGDERFWTALIACIMAACILLGDKYAGIINLPTLPMYEVLKKMVAHGRLAHKSNNRTAEDILNAYTQDFYGSMIIVKDHVLALGDELLADRSTTRTKVMGRVEHSKDGKTVDYILATNELKKFCTTKSFGYLDFIAGLKQLFKVEEGRKDLLFGVKGPAMRTNTITITMANIA